MLPFNLSSNWPFHTLPVFLRTLWITTLSQELGLSYPSHLLCQGMNRLDWTCCTSAVSKRYNNRCGRGRRDISGTGVSEGVRVSWLVRLFLNYWFFVWKRSQHASYFTVPVFMDPEPLRWTNLGLPIIGYVLSHNLMQFNSIRPKVDF